MKRFMMFLGTALLATQLCNGGEALQPKRGGICFRFDDNQPIERWQKMAQVFEKHGFRFSMAINSLQASKQAGYGELLADMAKRGYEVMDHTPEHTVITLTMDSPEEAAVFAKADFVEKVQGAKLFFKFIYNEKHPSTSLKISITQGKKIQVLAGNPINQNDYSKYLVFPNGEIYLLAKNNADSVLYSKHGENNVNLADIAEVEVKMATRNAFRVDDRALALVAQRSKALFAKMGVPAPKTFITPGGWGLFPPADQLQRVYGQQFGYAAGDQFYPRWAGSYSGKQIDRFRMSPYWNSLETNTVEREKALFADLLAKNYVIPVISHMWLHGVKDLDELLQRNDEFLAWVKEKNIPVKNYAQWADELFGGKVDPTSNVFPALTTDLNDDGMPDGYNLDKTATWDKEKCLLSGKGSLFYISALGGIESGKNVVRVEGCKAGDAKAQGLLLLWFCDENGNQTGQMALNFDFDSKEFTTVEQSFEMPQGACGVNTSFMFRGTTGTIRKITLQGAK